MTLRLVVRGLLVAIISLVDFVAAAPTDQIHGIVIDENMRGVSGAVVSYRRLPTFSPDTRNPFKSTVRDPGASGFVRTAADGTFGIGTLSNGEYRLCVEALDQNLLSTCDWSFGQSVRLDGGAVPGNVTIHVEHGTLLRVRINDPRQLLPATSSSSAAPRLIIGVIDATNRFHRAQALGSDAGGQNFGLLISFGRPHRLSVFTRHFTMTDAGNSPIDPLRDTFPVQAALGAQTPQIVFNLIASIPPLPRLP